MKHDIFTKLLWANTNGERFEAEYMHRVAHNDSSFKYTGSTSYRPDIATSHNVIVLEARDAHSDMKVLSDRLIRNTYFMTTDRAAFAGAAEFQAFDSEVTFDVLSGDVKSLLKELFPAKINKKYDPTYYQGKTLLAVEAFRNFAWPLRDWAPQIKMLNQAGLKATVKDAQMAYRSALEQIASDVKAGRLTKEQASLSVQGHLAEFSVKSGLHSAYKSWLAKVYEGADMTPYNRLFETYGH